MTREDAEQKMSKIMLSVTRKCADRYGLSEIVFIPMTMAVAETEMSDLLDEIMGQKIDQATG